MATLSLKTQNRKGGTPKWVQALGYTASFLDGEENRIICDAYEGFGRDYHEREKCNIEIHFKNKLVFNGTFEELVKKLK